MDDSDSTISGKKVSVEKIDSIRIEYLGNPTVHDLDPKSKLVLFMDHKESAQIIHVASFEGEILYTFSKWGDVPDNYGNLMAPLKITGRNSFLVYGSKGFMTYMVDGSLKSTVQHADAPYQGFNRIGLGLGIEELGNGYLIPNLWGGVSVPNGGEDYQKLHPLMYLDPTTGKSIPIASIPNSSIFLSGKYFFNNAWDPAFTITEDRMMVAFGLEPVVYIFERNPPYRLIGEFDLELPEYQYFKGVNDFSTDVRFFGQARTSGKILNIKMVESYLLVAYFPGFSGEDTEESFIPRSPEEARRFWEGVRQKYPHRMAVFDSSGHLISDFVLEGLLPT